MVPITSLCLNSGCVMRHWLMIGLLLSLTGCSRPTTPPSPVAVSQTEVSPSSAQQQPADAVPARQPGAVQAEAKRNAAPKRNPSPPTQTARSKPAKGNTKTQQKQQVAKGSKGTKAQGDRPALSVLYSTGGHISPVFHVAVARSGTVAATSTTNDIVVWDVGNDLKRRREFRPSTGPGVVVKRWPNRAVGGRRCFGSGLQ
jgi:hypothetical protein